jgi:hypothetical protein
LQIQLKATITLDKAQIEKILRHEYNSMMKRLIRQFLAQDVWMQDWQKERLRKQLEEINEVNLNG